MRLLDTLYDQPIITVNRASELLELPFSVVNVIIARFTELKILEEFTGRKRNRRYRYQEYLRLFDDEEVETTRGDLNLAAEGFTLG